MDKVKKNKVVRAWVDQHINDPYVQMSRKAGYRSRAAYKLLEIDTEIDLFKNVSVVIDLGCAPGSWSQVAINKTNSKGMVIGVDILPTEPISGLSFIQGDFTEENVLKQLLNCIGSKTVDLIISDMAPNLSGVRGVDQMRSAYLIELVLDFAEKHLKSGGNCLVKIFHGSEFDALVKTARTLFQQVVIKKPQASRSGSSETYLLCKNKY